MILKNLKKEPKKNIKIFLLHNKGFHQEAFFVAIFVAILYIS